VTFQKGEVRTCANCHGINTSDQTGTVAKSRAQAHQFAPSLGGTAAVLEDQQSPGNLQLSSANVSAQKNAGSATFNLYPDSRDGGAGKR